MRKKRQTNIRNIEELHMIKMIRAYYVKGYSCSRVGLIG